mgnify:CR=1 FL=1
MASTVVAVIGAGGVAGAHLRALAQCPDVQVAGVSDVSPERLAHVAREFGITRGFKDYRELLALPEVEAVHICLPNWLHAPVAIEALQAGKHVLCEKPPALTAADAQRMVDAARQSGRKLMICFNYRYRHDTRFVKRLIDAGDLGDIYYVKASWLRCSGIPGRKGGWFTRKALSGGGPLIDLGVHLLDLTLWLLGHPRPLTVTASTYAAFGPRGRHYWGGTTEPVTDPYEVEDLASAFIRLDSGATLLLETSWAMHTSAGRDEYFLHVYGTEGGVELDVRNYTTTDTVRVYRDLAGVPVDSAPHALQAGNGHAAAINHFLWSIREDRPPESTGEQGVALMQLIEAIYGSADQRRELTLPQEPTP